MKTVPLVAPQMQVEQTLVDGVLVGRAEAAQIGFVEIGKGANRLERIFRGNIEIVGGLVAEEDADAAALPDFLFDLPANDPRQIELRRE